MRSVKREKNANESTNPLTNQGAPHTWPAFSTGPRPHKLKDSVDLLLMGSSDTSLGDYKSWKLAPTVRVTKAFHVNEGVCKIIGTTDINCNQTWTATPILCTYIIT